VRAGPFLRPGEGKKIIPLPKICYNTSMELLRLDKSHVQAASDMLAEAFLEDGLVRRVCPDEAGRKESILPVFRFSAGLSVKSGEAWAVSGNMEGAALWLYSWRMFCPPWRWLALGGLEIRMRMSAAGYRELTRVSDRIDRERARVAPERFLYLSSLGVKKECRRKGFARSLVEGRIRKAGDEGLPTVVETNTSGALAFYESVGFQVLSTFRAADMDYYVLQFGE
jgi:ribosomal protein S18 acetylase RimI-like enzyme